MNQQNRSLDKDLALQANTNRAIRTTFIGAIAQFEKGFGYLWGHNKSKGEPLTDSEQRFLKLWLQVRNSVLDCGNEQSRVIDREFEKFIVRYNGYQYKFEVRPKQPGAR